MTVLILLITGPFMAIFFLAAIQTIEWNLDHGTAVPWLAYLLLVVVVIWGICVAKVRQSDIDEFDKLNNKKS